MTYIQPLTCVCLIVITAGLIRIRYGGRFGLAATGLVSLFVLTWPPMDWLLSRPLEARYPVEPFPPDSAQALVVLSSSFLPPRYARPYVISDKEGYRRCEHAAWLYRHWRRVPVLASGGPQTKGTLPLSALMRDLLRRAGVDDADILTEDASRSTRENAVNSAAILKQHGLVKVALIVEAFAMPRAAAAFRHEGIDVVPAPCSFRTFDASSDDFLPTWKSLERNEGTVHEVLGLAWYRLRGWI
jgi:uncharacterized SAM-binding protein YcdF (DUF218 family)